MGILAQKGLNKVDYDGAVLGSENLKRRFTLSLFFFSLAFLEAVGI